MPFLRHRLATFAILLCALIATDNARAGDVTIYRCVGTGNQISLQDHPCPKDARQDVRQMIRPQDAPPRPQQVAAATPPAPQATEIRVIHVRDPQPLYECQNAETGDTYMSQTGIPQSRYVPFWTLGLGDSFANVGGRTPRPMPSPMSRPPAHVPHDRFVYPYSVYVEDTCVRLPQEEACQHLRDRNDALGTLIFNSQPSDRERYERERKGLVEQIRDECSTMY